MNKAALIFCLLSGFASRSFAAVDFIECQTSIEDTTTHAVSNSSGTYASYRNVSKVGAGGQPYPSDIKVTNSEIAFQQSIKSSNLTYKINYVYDFAFAQRASGGTTEGRQNSCSKLNFEVCQDPGPGETRASCSASTSACSNPSSDPFDVKYGWSATSVIGGEPVFNERLLGTVSNQIVFEPGRSAWVSISCKFKGTYF